jgi:uncharacterized protein
MSLDAAPVAPVPPVPPEPVAPPERLAAVDVLRGVAVLGILPMNIVDFAWGFAAYFDPTRGGGFTGLDAAVWVVSHLLFDQKFLTIFSMLFGAGLVLMGERADARGRPLAGVYYRRVLWLLVIGAVHAYLIWAGDILVVYAECGLLLYPFRRRSARTLIVLGTLAVLVVVPVGLALATGLELVRSAAAQADAATAAGETPTGWQAWAQDAWQSDLRKLAEPTPAERDQARAEEEALYRGGYGTIVAHRAVELLPEQTIAFPLFWIWDVGGRMLLGMGLMKLGVFAAARPARSYARLAAAGYGLGLPLVAYDTWAQVRSDFALADVLRSVLVFNHVGAVLVALGHVAVVMLACQARALPRLTARLAAVGRMALTNYLVQSLVCSTLFYGYGFGLFGTVPRTGLVGIVLAVWAAQLLYSPASLAQFRFGPAEWVWRSLTYWRLQPMRRPPEPAGV